MTSSWKGKTFSAESVTAVRRAASFRADDASGATRPTDIFDLLAVIQGETLKPNCTLPKLPFSLADVVNRGRSDVSNALDHPITLDRVLDRATGSTGDTRDVALGDLLISALSLLSETEELNLVSTNDVLATTSELAIADAFGGQDLSADVSDQPT